MVRLRDNDLAVAWLGAMVGSVLPAVVVTVPSVMIGSRQPGFEGLGIVLYGIVLATVGAWVGGAVCCWWALRMAGYRAAGLTGWLQALLTGVALFLYLSTEAGHLSPVTQYAVLFLLVTAPVLARVIARRSDYAPVRE